MGCILLTSSFLPKPESSKVVKLQSNPIQMKVRKFIKKKIKIGPSPLVIFLWNYPFFFSFNFRPFKT